MSYYSVKVKCGHVGDRMYVPIEFSIEADSQAEAIKLAKDFPRVKRNREDAVIAVEEIDYQRFKEIIERNQTDPYLKAHSKEEMKYIDLTGRIKKEPPQHVQKRYKGNKYVQSRKCSLNKKKEKHDEDYENSDNKKYMEILNSYSSYNGDLESLKEELLLQEEAEEKTLNCDSQEDDDILSKYLYKEEDLEKGM